MSRAPLTNVPFVLKDHYHVLCDWWSGHHWPVVPIEMLPSTGIVASVGDEMVAAGFLYLTDSSVAWIEWLVTNPSASLKSRLRGLDHVVARLTEEAYAGTRRVIFTSSNNEGLINRLKNHGFQVGDTNTTQLLHFRRQVCQP